ncbi:MAG: hypothetical protein ABIH34_06395 [Nanoarchaeota archaeon]
MEGEIHVQLPGSNKTYQATKAVVSWETPMEVEMNSMGEKEITGKLVFKGYKERIALPDPRIPSLTPMLDPDIELHTTEGIVRIHQAHGIPVVYILNGKVTYDRKG